MNDEVVVDLFVEDRAHEEFLKPLIGRVAREAGTTTQIRVRAARGGRPRVLDELRLYQRSVVAGLAGLSRPDVLVAVIDANCHSHARAREEVGRAIGHEFRAITAPAVPRPSCRAMVPRGPTLVRPGGRGFATTGEAHV